MSLSTLDDDDDDDVQGIDSLVLSLEEFSRTLDESSDVLSSTEPQLNGWIVDRTAAQNENKPSCRRSAAVVKDSKELRSSTPRRTVSRQFNRNREDLVEFKHFLQTGRYIEAYRNEKTSRQEAALKELANKNDRRRASDSCVDLGKNVDHSENLTSKNVPSVVSMKEAQTAQDDNAVKPLIVVSSKGLSRPANLPMSGQFHGRKLQWRPTIGSRKITNAKGTQWSQTHIDATLEITSQGTGDVSHLVHSNKQSEDYNPLQERRSSANLVVKRAELGGSSTTLRADSKTLSQTTGARCSPVEKCDAWVKNRDNELGSISKGKEQHSANARALRGFHCPFGQSSQLSLRGSSLTSPQQKDSCSTRAAESSTGASGMDYSKYTDMFKNVLEFYGTRRLRPKSHSAVEQLLSMKT